MKEDSSEGGADEVEEPAQSADVANEQVKEDATEPDESSERGTTTNGDDGDIAAAQAQVTPTEEVAVGEHFLPKLACLFCCGFIHSIDMTSFQSSTAPAADSNAKEEPKEETSVAEASTAEEMPAAADEKEADAESVKPEDDKTSAVQISPPEEEDFTKDVTGDEPEEPPASQQPPQAILDGGGNDRDALVGRMKRCALTDELQQQIIDRVDRAVRIMNYF